MNSNQFSFKNLLEISSITQNNQSTQKNQSFNKSQTESLQFYKQKYFETKENVKKFIQLVEKEFQKLTKTHNEQKQKLQKQISELKKQLCQKKDTCENDVSNFTVRSKKSSVNMIEKSFSSNKRSSSNETKNNLSVMCFDGIQGFGEQSKIMNQTSKSFAVSTKSQTLIELENALNQERQSSRSRISQKSQLNALDNLTENDLSINSLNVNEYKSHILGYRKSKLQQGKLKQKQQNVLNYTESKQNTPMKKEEKKQILISREDFSNPKGKQNQNLKQKQNQDSSAIRQDSSNKVQQTSVRNILKNLRNTIKVSTEKQSKLDAPIFTR